MQLAYGGTQQETIAGTRTTLDVLIAEQDLLNARLSLANARRNANVAAYQLLSGVGGLTAKALNLPIKLYDPNCIMTRTPRAGPVLATDRSAA